MDRFSVAEIAQNCGVSPQAIRQWCFRNHVAKVGKQWEINESVAQAIYEYYSVSLSDVAQATKGTCASNESTTIEILREQLRVKDEQLRAKDEQIASLGEQLSQTTKALLNAQEQIGAAQLLHAADRKDDLLPKPQEQAKEKPRQGFFARLFGR